jgi:hypothetical protein
MKFKSTIASCARTVALGVARMLASAMVWLLLLSLGGAISTVYGVLLIAGQGWACIAAGAFLMAGAAVIHRGLSNG